METRKQQRFLIFMYEEQILYTFSPEPPYYMKAPLCLYPAVGNIMHTWFIEYYERNDSTTTGYISELAKGNAHDVSWQKFRHFKLPDRHFTIWRSSPCLYKGSWAPTIQLVPDQPATQTTTADSASLRHFYWVLYTVLFVVYALPRHNKS